MIKVRGALRLIKGKVGHCLLMMEWGGGGERQIV